MSQNKANSHQCVICNALYNSCDLCKDIQTYTPWRALCDTSRHYQIYMIISMLRGKVMNESEVRDSLNHINVTIDEIKTFIPAVQDILLPIMEAKTESISKTVSEVTFDDLSEEPKYTKTKRK